MKWLAAIIIIITLARLGLAAGGKPDDKSVQVERFKIKAEKNKVGKKETREFPLMFNIADKAAKHKAAKHKKAKQKGDK